MQTATPRHKNVLSALIGDSELTVRRATPAETDAWLTTASTVERRKLRRLVKKTPTPVEDAGAECQAEVAAV
jgi:hypothetical protein